MMVPEKDHIVSMRDMKARWALGELMSERTKAFYHDPRVPALLAKLHGRHFEQLTSQERDELVEVWEPARGVLLAPHYLTDVVGFRAQSLSNQQVAKLLAMSQMASGRFITVSAYAASPRPTGPGSDRDPRVVADRRIGTASQISEPVIIGRYHGRQVLIDGYGRAVFFLRVATMADLLPALTPVARNP